MMKKFIAKVVLILSSCCKGKYAGKLIGLLDLCRKTVTFNKRTFAGQIHERMDLKNILPLSNSANLGVKEIEKTDKLKVRIAFPGGCAWNHIHSMYEAFAKDDKFQTYVVVRDAIQYTSVLDCYGCKYITYRYYSIKEDRPDIFIATNYSSYDKDLYFEGCRQYIGKVFAEIPNVVMNEKDNETHWKYVSNAYSQIPPDYWLLDPLVYNSLVNYLDNSKMIKMGSPQFDEIYNEVGQDHPWPKSWEKLKGKKVFLWCTDHGINESYPTNGFTIDLYLGAFIKYFKEHEDIALIFRPHPEFVREMGRKFYFWSIDDINKLKSYMNNTPNIVWDDTHDYCRAYDACDALIVDANCSITLSFLATGKPVSRLMRYDIKEWLISPELYDCYYYAHNFEECVSFIKMICDGKDPKAEVRNMGCRQAILHFDGKNGERIKEFVVSKLDK